MCFYDIGLWKFYKTGTLNKLASAYGYHKYFSVSCMLMELGLPSFNTVVFNADFISSA